MGNKKHHEVNVTLAVNQDGTSRVRCITVGQDWKPHREAIDHTRFVDKEGQSSPAKVVTDLEKGLADALTPDEAFWGPCHIHVVRYVGQSLWSDGLPQGERKKTILGTVQGLLAHLRNSLDLHLPKGETREIQHRITQTTKEFRRLATLIFDEGLKKTARFLRRAATMVTTFATLALQGQWIPWNTNRVERVMLEVSKRCKHRGMNWTSHGGQALLTLLVVRFVEPETYQEHQRRRLHGPETYKTDIAIQVVVT